MRYIYAYGFKSEIKAELALEDMLATGEVSAAEKPKVTSYMARVPKRRYWKITLDDGVSEAKQSDFM